MTTRNDKGDAPLRKLGYSPRVELDISEEATVEAVRNDSAHCMIADAITAQIPGASRVSVDLQTIRWSDRQRGERYTYLTPPMAQDALIRFDQGQPLVPFKLKLSRGQVTRIKAATKAQVRSRAERQAAVAAKVATGEPLTGGEKRTKAAMDAKTPPPSTRTGPAEQVFEKGSPIRRGGTPPPIAVLAHTRGRARVYGAKTLLAPVGVKTLGLQIID
jgi:hypothetical protein